MSTYATQILDKLAVDTSNLRVLSPMPVKPLLEEIQSLEDKIIWTDMGHKGKQASLQYRTGKEPWIDGVGRLEGAERDYFNLNSELEGTMLAGLIERYQMFRARLMWVGPYACYSMHKDATHRIHIPIVTNPNCFFVFNDSVPLHMPEGWSYKVDTTRYHTFMNCSDKPRLHLVGAVLS